MIKRLSKQRFQLSKKGFSDHDIKARSSSSSILQYKGDKTKPLVLMLPWFGASPKAVSKYSSLYENMGCDVIIKQAKVIDFLRPHYGLKVTKQFLFDLQNMVKECTRPIVIHSFSIGCYFYSLMLYNIKNNFDEFNDVASNIQVQILDSPVIGTLNEMAVGISISASHNSLVQEMIRNTVLSYFFVTRPFTVKLYNTLIDTIKYAPPVVPSLLMTSENDPMALPLTFNEFVSVWKNLNADVTEKVWTDSEHAKHYKFHPELYVSMIYKLLSTTFGDATSLSLHVDENKN